MFRGSIVALVTPLLKGGVDVDRLRALAEYHIEAGTRGIVAAGTTGEAGTLTHDEKLLVIKTVVEQVRGRIPVIAGTALNATQQCIQLTQEAMDLGVDAVLIMTPAYIKPTQEGLYQHYRNIAQAVAIPIILYNVPSRTACDLLPETIARLGHISNIIGVKEATGQMARLEQILHTSKDAIEVFSGDDVTVAEWMLAGAKGVISVTANVAPQLMSQLCEAGLNGDETTCLRIAEQLMPLHRLMFVESNPIPVKWAMHRLGLIGDEIRLPLTPLIQEHQSALDEAIQFLRGNRL